MSALTEQVAREHYPYDDGVRGRKCSCGTRPPRYEELNAWHREHVAEVTERAVRARLEAAIRLVSPDHITPQGARIIRAALTEETK